MSAPSAPVIPPRPARSPRPLAADIPSIPPRPSNRRLDRSVSPGRDSYAPSPLNGPPHSAGLSRTTSNDIPARPPSVTIPSLGEEGIEYADLDAQNAEPAQTRNVGSDLKLHAPKPSFPKARVQAVTRADSDQAIATIGLGKSSSPVPEDSDRGSRSLHSKPSGSRAHSNASSTRRQSLQFDEEQGIPEIGQRVPMLAFAGDVQAPSPAPPRTGSASGQQRRHHHRTRSGRDVPPGSYGLHGHGVHAADRFEKAWYDKHPDELAREEQGQYGPAIAERSAWALSSDDLNRLVRSSSAIDKSLDTSPAFIGTPEEEVGYIATDEFTRQDAQASVESPLRHSTFTGSELQRTRSALSTASSDAGNRVIHVDKPYHSSQHPDGFAHTPEPQSAHDFDDGAIDDDQPILAADESRPGSAYLHPAISPRRDYHDLERVRSRTPSAPNSRPSSLHGAPAGLTRWNSRGEELDDVHTPLEDVEEYEPLFPEDEKFGEPLSATERFQKRADLLKHRFPSQDIWEDTPDSLQLHASVSTPDLPETQPKANFETPEAEENRKRQTEQIDSRQVAAQILHSHGPLSSQARPTRPNTIKHRFPSQDIWEDAPESQQLVTTIEPEEPEEKSPEAVTAPTIPSRPSIPPRPQKIVKPSDGSADEKKAPIIPDRPKPQIPFRPSKPVTRDQTDAPPINRNKPVIPARPSGGKFAGVKANFLSDLNSRLQLGPQAPKPAEKKTEEVPEEKAPLADARKGRARGPARRKPAASSSVETRLPSIPEIRIMDAWNVWELGADGNLIVGIPESKNQETETGQLTDPFAVVSEEKEASIVVEPEPEVKEELSEPADIATVVDDHEHISPKQSVGQSTSTTEGDQTIETGPTTTNEDSVSEKIIEQLTATADDKKPSDGSVEEESTA